MYNKQMIPLNIVQYYLKNRTSLRETAERFGIHYQTLFKWVKLYKKGDKEKLLPSYKRPWARADKKTEEKVVFLKEKNPALTVRAAKRVIEKEGVKISLKGIWQIWKMYGYAGFKKENFSGDFREYVHIAPKVKEWIAQAKVKIEQGKLKEAAEILNALPFCGDDAILVQVPDRFLQPKRRLEKLPAFFRKIPFPTYLQRIRNLKKMLFKMEYIYSGIRAGIEEIRALTWLGRYEEGIHVVEEIEGLIYKKVDKKALMPLPLLISITKGFIYASLLQIDKAIIYLKKCRNFSRHIRSPILLGELANFYLQLAFYSEAESLIRRALKYISKEDRTSIYSMCINLAYIFVYKGNYPGILKLLKEKIFETKEMYREPILLLRAQAYLGLGHIEKAEEQTRKVFLISQKKGILPYMRTASYLTASIHSALGEEKKARDILRRYRKFLAKYKISIDFIMWEIILGHKKLPKGIEKHRMIRLALLLRKSLESKMEKDLRRAYFFAKRRGLLGTFHRLCLLMPKAVRTSIEKGKPTGLPKAILKLPIFNKKTPIYNIKFLGSLIVYKNQRYLKIHPIRKRKSSNGIKLPPKDTAFLIHIALRAGGPNKKILLENLYRNFWPNSRNPSGNLSHLFVRIKKALKIPTHLLEVSYGRDNPVLINKGIYFTNDYTDFEQTLIRARALRDAEEWGFARKEYLRAFALIRGEPFKKMYDFWSENMRRVILNQLETEAINFAKSCLEYKNKKDAKKVLQTVSKATPQSEEIKKLLQNL